MVSSDARNNLVIVIIITAVAMLSFVFINQFIDSMQKVTQHGEKAVDKIGTNLINNVSVATNRSNNNSKMIVDALNNVSKNNNEAIDELAGIMANYSKLSISSLESVKNSTGSNEGNLKILVDEQNQTNNMLAFIINSKINNNTTADNNINRTMIQSNDIK